MSFRFPTEKHLIDHANDRFGYNILADSILSEILLQMETPNSFGLYGNWGSGKSSLLHFIKQKIENNENRKYNEHLCVYFEPWKYEYAKESDLLFALLRKIETDIQLPEGEWKKIAKDLMTVGFWMAGELGGLDPAKMPTWNDHLWTEYQGWVDSVESFKVEFEKAIQARLIALNKKTLVIFIDDLDRCLPNNAVRLLECLKNFLSVDGTLFILAIDKRSITRMIEKQYGLYRGYGEEYLMKIIHYNYELPVPDTSFYVEEILEFMETENEKKIAKFVLREFLKEPRKAKYVFNNFAIIAALSQKVSREYFNSLGSDVYTPKLITLITFILLVKFPSLFEGNFEKKLQALQNYSQHQEAREEQFRNLNRKFVDCLSEEELLEVIKILHLGKPSIEISFDKIIMAYIYISRMPS